MKTKHSLALGAFTLALIGVLGAKCPSIPSIQEAAVELVKTESTVIGPFEARGNNIADDGMVDLVAEYDIAGALADAHLDVSDVESITVRAVEVRVSKPDPDPGRMIIAGVVRARRVATAREGEGGCPVGGAFAEVVSSWTGVVNNYQSFSTENVMINAEGITLIDCLLEVYLDALRAGENPDDLSIEWQVDGLTNPKDDADFDWEVRLTIDIVGQIRTDVLG